MGTVREVNEMSRYIDADKLMLDIRLDKRPTFRGAKIPPSVKETMFAYLDSAPHIDIVRCKECKNEPICNHSVQHTTHDAHSITIGSKTVEWCSYGERREP